MRLGIIANLYMVVEFIELLLFYFGILRMRYNRNKILNVFIVLFSLFFLNMILVLSGDTYLDAVITPICLLSVFLIQECRFVKKIFVFYVAELFLSILNYIPICFVMFQKKIQFYDWKKSGYVGILCECFFGFLEILCILKMRRKQSCKKNVVWDKSQIIPIVVGLHCGVFIMAANQTMLVYKDMSDTAKILYVLSTFIVILVFLVVCIWQGILQTRNRDMQMEKEQREFMLRVQEEQYRQLVESDKKMKRFRHDIRAHLTAIHEMIKNKEYEEVNDYIQDIYEESDLFTKSYYTGCTAVDAVMNDLIADMESENITFKFNGTMVIREGVHDFNLCSIFYNGLKNAMEACREYMGKKEIEVSVGNFGERISIKIRNTCNPIYENMDTYVGKTKKQDKSAHGFGVQNMRISVEQYDGTIAFQYEDGYFETVIIV